ncbi:hypothetical protein BDZ97DRAFT_1920910 [Flammula alnicola]|nr:hypothetical protein BDZ97DRAFT_1920910 [Flammula alnicola]
MSSFGPLPSLESFEPCVSAQKQTTARVPRLTLIHSIPTQTKQVPSLSSSILLPSLYNSDPPPEYAYTRALSAYSAVVQLYLRAGQLDTALTRSTRLNDDSQPWCRFGCSVLEDSHHIFVDCPRFDNYRHHATDELLASTRAILDTFKTPAHTASVLTQTVKGLTLDSEVWPLHKSFFYYGVIPALDQIIPSSSHNQPQNTSSVRLRARLASEWHYGCIKLAARIWGTVRRVSAPYSSKALPSTSSNRPTDISLPSNLTFIASALSPSSKLRVSIQY